MEIKHNFVSPKSDGADTTQVQPSNWNEIHTITMAAPGVVGRSAAGAGAATELATVPVSLGGTGQSSLQSAINSLAGGVTANRVLRADGTNVVLAQVALTTDVTGTLPVPNGGLGLSSVPTASVLVTSDTNTITTVTAGAKQSVRRNASNTAWEAYSTINMTQMPIFGAAAVTATPISNSENITFNRLFDTGLTSGTLYPLNYNNSLFIVSSSTSQSNLATSTDGETWTLRAMSGPAQWRIACSGTNVLAVSQGGTTVNISTNGTTYSTATALPGNAGSVSSPRAINSTTFLVPASVGSTVYLTTNHGASWSTETLPANIGSGGLHVINGKFWFWTASTTAYYSSTGTTGSWTVVSLPVSISQIYSCNDIVYFAGTGAGAQLYKMEDEDTVTTITGILTTYSGGHAMLIEGVYAVFNSTFGNAATFHANGPILRTSSVGLIANNNACVNIGSTYCLSINNNQILTITAAGSQTAYFEV